MTPAAVKPCLQRSRSWLPMDRTTDRADAKSGPAEIQVIRAGGPVRGADAEHILAVRRLYGTQRAFAALTGLQA